MRPCMPFLRPVCRLFAHLPLYPRHKQVDDLLLLNGRQLLALLDSVPFFKATSATATAGMLSLKYRMTLGRGLTSVVFRKGGSKSLSYKVLGVAAYGIVSLLLYIQPVLVVKTEGTSEF